MVQKKKKNRFTNAYVGHNQGKKPLIFQQFINNKKSDDFQADEKS